MADRPTDIVMLSERITVAHFESEHFRAQLVERLSWAVGDADAAEQLGRDQRSLAKRVPKSTRTTLAGLSRCRGLRDARGALTNLGGNCHWGRPRQRSLSRAYCPRWPHAAAGPCCSISASYPALIGFSTWIIGRSSQPAASARADGARRLVRG
jgi:hypothetical protein